MPHQNSVFHGVVKQIPWGRFDRLVATHGSDKHVRQLSTKHQFLALLYGQLAGAGSLREIIGGLDSHALRLYHAGGRPARRSTLADANAQRPSAVFSELFSLLAAQVHDGLRRSLAQATYLIDSTSVRLSGLGAAWAKFSDTTCGAKVHVVYAADAEVPIYAAVTAARVNDISAAQEMPIEPGATYVFDLGYYDYAWWAKLDQAGCRIVTRFKSNTPLEVVSERPLDPGGPILSDRTGMLPQRQAKNRKNPMGQPVREVRIKLETGQILRILSNDLTAKAQDIADLYKRRWMIELFFRWIKQTLKIRHLIGRSENAVRIQIAVALIAYLLLRLAQAKQTAIESPLAFARLVRASLMHRRDIRHLTRPPPTPPIPVQQMTLNIGQI